MKKLVYFCSFLVILACNSNSGNVESSPRKVDKKTKEKELVLQKIGELNQKTDPKLVKEINKKDVKELMLTYQDYANKYPEDSLAAEFYFSAANQAIGLKKFEHSIQLFNKVFESYPDFDKRSSCLMMMGLVFDQNLNKEDKARQAYEKVLEYFPGSKDAESAEAMLQILGLTDIELIERFEQLNK